MKLFKLASVVGMFALTMTGCGRSSSPARPLQAIATDDSHLVNDSVQECIARFTDVSSKLTCIPGLKVESEVFSNVPSGYRRFNLTIEQPIDHRYPEGRKFGQRLILWHRDVSEPMILHTSGYKIFNEQLYLLASKWQTNQIQVTHRYFVGAEPNEATWDWAKLDIIQSAADFHRIVASLKQIYAKNWVNNGASKGGMTSVFFRRFYPQDLAGTVADVAPLSFAPEDTRYVDFVDHAGGDSLKECRQKLRDLQRVYLTRRADFATRVGTGTYHFLGSSDVAFEHAVISMPYAFHQYHNVKATDPVRCETIPAADAAADVLWQWLLVANSPLDLDDNGIKVFIPYYYQANTELGGSSDRLDLIADLLQHPYNAQMYGPKGVNQVYSEDAMRDVERWVKTESEGLMFVYGENDPWSAGMFPFRPEADSLRFVVPKGNHGSKFVDLPAEQQKQFVDVLSRWLGKSMPVSCLAPSEMPKDDPAIRL